MYLLYFFTSVFLSTLFLFVRNRYSYWKHRNVPQLDPVFPLGNLNRLKYFNMLEKLNEVYTKLKGRTPIVGIYLFTRPALVALDLDLIKSILIKDFPTFTDRMQFVNITHDPLSNHLFHMEGSSWKKMRAKLSPTFTSGKMRFMFPTVVKVANEFESAMRVELEKSDVVEIRELLTRYTTDVIGSCVFGLECNSLKDPDAEFCAYGRQFMEKPHHGTLIRHFLLTYNKLSQKLGFIAHDQNGIDFFMKVIRDTLALREANNIRRKDFMNLLIELKNQKDPDGSDRLTIEEIAAQSYVFFVAGFETSASNMSFTLYELAKQPLIQEKLRQEIIDVLEKHNNQLTYEAMSDMVYLSQCITESMRKYPALVSLTRIANENYPIVNTKFVIEKGTPVFIPVRSIHYDPDIYSNPNKYDPDRFSPENVQTRDAMTFLGFGDGPRNCIGLRFARMQVRIGLIMLLRSFKFSVSEKTPEEIAFNPRSFVLLPEDGICLKVEAV